MWIKMARNKYLNYVTLYVTWITLLKLLKQIDLLKRIHYTEQHLEVWLVVLHA